ncbi:anthranilate phosphoribosyltransferase [Pyrolobus fumarii 1A]|uniref:Anthranilate phosphoribosyltransferase n=1 Tax=Pyrolobus fumarii (strain DSM 11204 / 1A) TaxID=694429 RepID=G0ECV8_PYRF1|nr:anthranilate phosphoribosyltransferase [Pyrolobus fumarii]AEM39678.1 anthranilate phosphoribosyltransferase [Pyrolobus fumarii 1A]
MASLPELLEKILSGPGLTHQEAREIALMMLKGGIDDVGIAAILVALRARGETPEVVAGFAAALRETCVKVQVPPGVEPIDTAGTGGDRSHTINASTAAALAASALGAYVLKHGNRSVSSKSGSADFLERLGYKIDHGPDEARCMLEKARFAFLYAPRYHPAMKRVMPVRRKLGIRTVFNLVGPLSNPGLVKRQVLGVASPQLLETMSKAGAILGYERLLVVHGEPGIDEVSVTGATTVVLVEKGSVLDTVRYTPEELGAKRHPLHLLRVETPGESVERVRRVFQGEGAPHDTDFIAVNTGFALYAAGVVSEPREGVELFKQALAEGRLAEHLENVLRACRECCGY